MTHVAQTQAVEPMCKTVFSNRRPPQGKSGAGARFQKKIAFNSHEPGAGDPTSVQ